jgi:hypothetical protein
LHLGDIFQINFGRDALEACDSAPLVVRLSLISRTELRRSLILAARINAGAELASLLNDLRLWAQMSAFDVWMGTTPYGVVAKA